MAKMPMMAMAPKMMTRLMMLFFKLTGSGTYKLRPFLLACKVLNSSLTADQGLVRD